jgi:hypothetical protein
MPRLASLAVLGFLAGAIGGCPIYTDDDDGYCDYGDCHRDYYCSAPSDCPSDEVCGIDNECHIGDCSSWACADGYRCEQMGSNDYECVIDVSTTGGGGEGGSGGSGGGDVVYCGNPDDCAADETCGTDGACQAGDCTAIDCIFGFTCDQEANPPACIRENPAGCGADADCSSLGADHKCLSGVCTPPADQCFDQTQCPNGDVCAEGKCVPSCAGGASCPSAYMCDAVETCTVPTTSCNITNDCGGGPAYVCVDGACVPRAFNGDCLPGEVWVDNGCIPDQSPIFVCQTEGVQDACAAGSICLHHSCYINCAAPNETACVALPEFDQCKAVTTPTGTFSVCGSDQNLGGECDPTAGIDCMPGLVCIDGFCK